MTTIIAAWTTVRAWLSRRGAELRLAVGVAVGSVAAYGLAEVLGLAQGYWAVFTVVIVMQASVGGSLKATVERLIGTLGGAVFGAAVAMIVPSEDPYWLGV